MGSVKAGILNRCSQQVFTTKAMLRQICSSNSNTQYLVFGVVSIKCSLVLLRTPYFPFILYIVVLKEVEVVNTTLKIILMEQKDKNKTLKQTKTKDQIFSCRESWDLVSAASENRRCFEV